RVLLQGVCNRDKAVCAKLREHVNDLWIINNNFLKVNIYYEDLNFNNVTEEPQIEIQQFLSDVGGAFGLWIGLSILSFLEVVQLLVELCNYFVAKTCKERRGRRENDRRGNLSNNIGFHSDDKGHGDKPVGYEHDDHRRNDNGRFRPTFDDDRGHHAHLSAYDARFLNQGRNGPFNNEYDRYSGRNHSDPESGHSP
ncbi:ASI1B-like protein, partial [Mya arenaria]